MAVVNLKRTQYTSLGGLLTGLPQWMDEVNAQRIKAYQLYEDIYWTEPNTFVLDQRGTDSKPIYLPSARIIVETAHRYIAREFNFKVNTKLSTGTTDEIAAIQNAFGTLLKRVSWRSMFPTQKRYGLIRGDWFWHITANPTASPGRRLRIDEIDAAAVFWITDPNDDTRITGVHVIDIVVDDKNKELVKRQTYRKVYDPDTGAVTGISSECGLYDMEKGKWDAPVRPVTVVKPLTMLPPEITTLPVYHVKNRRVPTSLYGVSELRGFERVMGALNQGISDEELSLAMDGIGVYATTSGPPVDEDDNEVPWVLGPGRVVEIDEQSTFERVAGVTSVSPWRDHETALKEWLFEASGTPSVARGIVDVSVAQSGISLTLQAGPLLARVDEHNDLILDTHDQMAYDLLHQWFPAFEKEQGIKADTGVVVEAAVGDTLPADRDAKITEVTTLYAAGLVDIKWCQDELTKVGFEFPEGIIASILAEQAAKAAAADPLGTRLAAEGAGTPTTDPNAGADGTAAGA
jgi:hypothetical protein